MPGELSETDWDTLLERIRDGECTPFLGAGACHGVLPLGGDIAKRWATEKSYPLDDPWNLPRVAQFRVVKERDAMRAKQELARLFRDAEPPDFNEPDEPHAVLASLPLPVFLTTNYDNFMLRALKEWARKEPQQEFARWNRIIKKLPSAFDEDQNFVPTAATPVVYHLHGHAERADSMVLTEDDYLDFLLNLGQDEDRVLVPRIQQAITGASLLFLGYSITDLDFRVLFRSLVTYLEKSLWRAHISVQLPPEVSDELAEEALEYLNMYFGAANIRVYWGTCREFVAELKGRWEEFKGGG